MPTDHTSTDRIEEAIDFAVHAHRGQLRKGSLIPYILHPLGVCRLLLTHGCDEETVIAGVLHDVVEDTPVTIERIAARYGPRTASLVESVTEADKRAPWEERKLSAHLKMRTAPIEAKLVTAADKIDNLRSIAIDRERSGEKMWRRFKRGRKEQEWHYRTLSTILGNNHPLFSLFDREIERVFPRTE